MSDFNVPIPDGLSPAAAAAFKDLVQSADTVEMNGKLVSAKPEPKPLSPEHRGVMDEASRAIRDATRERPDHA